MGRQPSVTLIRNFERNVKVVIVIDTREQRPLDFSFWKDVTVQRRELWPGDYTVLGGSQYLAVERKSVSDLVGTMKTGYAGIGSTTPKRFDRELMALHSVIARGGRAFIIVEPDGPLGTVCPAYEQIKAHSYRSIISPDKVLAFIQSIRSGWRVPVIMTDSRTQSAEIVYKSAILALAVKRARMAEDRFADSLDADIADSLGGEEDGSQFVDEIVEF